MVLPLNGGSSQYINLGDWISYFSYGVFGRYTIPLSETFAVFGELDVFAANGKVTTPSLSGTTVTYSESKTNGFGVVFTPNLFINFKNSFGFTPKIISYKIYIFKKQSN